MTSEDRPVFTFLTDREHELMDLTAQLARGLFELCGENTRDKAEVAHEIHGLQTRILAQAGARAYPQRYRLMGEFR
jgi:hypothetical protein